MVFNRAHTAGIRVCHRRANDTIRFAGHSGSPLSVEGVEVDSFIAHPYVFIAPDDHTSAPPIHRSDAAKETGAARE